MQLLLLLLQAREHVVIRDHQVIRGCQVSSEVVRCHQRLSGVIRGHQVTSEVIRGHQKISEVIRGHQRSSEVISTCGGADIGSDSRAPCRAASWSTRVNMPSSLQLLSTRT